MACNYNDFLTATGFTMTIQGYDTFKAAIQSFTHPTLSVGHAVQHTPKRDIPTPGDKFQYDPLNITMLLNADMSVYKEVLGWLEDCVNVTEDVEKDITLYVMSSNSTVAAKILYKDAFPIDIGAISFASTDSNDTVITVDVTFAFSSYGVIID